MNYTQHEILVHCKYMIDKMCYPSLISIIVCNFFQIYQVCFRDAKRKANCTMTEELSAKYRLEFNGP